MAFDNRYYTAMDRGYYLPSYNPGDIPLQGSETETGLSPRNIGISTPPMQDQIRALEARIRQGATRVELGFTGREKGSMGQGATTPEMYGTKDRQEIKEMAAFNKIQLSTHATVSMGSLAGLSEGGFSEAARESALNEIKRAIDFASDTTKGGAVVVHTGEFPRAISESFPEFASYPEEPEKATMHLVDKRTGRVIEQVRKHMPVVLPVWETDAKTGDYVYLDEEKKRRKPVYDKDTGRFKVQEYGWDFFEAEAKRMSQKEGRTIMPEEASYRLSLDAREEQAKSWALIQSREYRELDAAKEKLKKALEVYEELEKTVPEDQKWKLQRQVAAQYASDFVPPESKMPVEMLKERLWEIERRLESQREFGTSYEQQAKEISTLKENVRPIKEYAVDKSAETIARAAMFAMQQTNAKKLPEPLFVAPENLFPEQYGSHPQELKRLILDSREKMSELLQKNGYDEKKADEIASQHIKATFDVGHAYTWRKYFKEDPKKSWDENTKAFNDWLFKQVDDLNKSKIIGHVHISDNFGFYDEHVTPGQGLVPLKEFIEKVKKAGIKSVMVEPAHQDYRAMLGGWTAFGSSIYGLTVPPTREGWADIEHSYFGLSASPYFLYGPTVPNPEHWVLWTGVQME